MGSRRPNSIVHETGAGEKKPAGATKKGMTQRRLSELSGVPLGRLRRIERGIQSVTFADLVKLARALGRDPLDMCREVLIRAGEHHPRQ
jgi:transcriptional regulator with XRE-family HTH domain